MKRLFLFAFSIVMLFFMNPVTIYARESYPAGSITIHNSSSNPITAVGTYGKFTLSSHETKTVSYRALSYACASAIANCITHFYIDNRHVGSAVINVQTGKLINLNLVMKMIRISTYKSQNIIRSIIIS